MASLLNALGLYQPPIVSVDVPNAAVGGLQNLSGDVAPEGVVDGTFGNLYILVTTGELYVKTTATGNTGWLINAA